MIRAIWCNGWLEVEHPREVLSWLFRLFCRQTTGNIGIIIMKRNKFSSMLLVGIAMLCVVSTFAQDKFSDANVEYEFVLPEKEWKMTVKPSEYSPNVEYVYKDRRDGHLQVRKIVVEADSLFSEMIREEEQKLQFVPGYVAGKRREF